jgi:hypothetical protein
VSRAKRNATNKLGPNALTLKNDSIFMFRFLIGLVTDICDWVISGFRRDVNEICALLGYNAASIGNPLHTFRDNLSVPS